MRPLVRAECARSQERRLGLAVSRIDGLRVADASVMPNIVRANTNLTCIMIGERAADWMQAEV